MESPVRIGRFSSGVWAGAGAVGLACVIVFGLAMTADFVAYDDPELIVSNPYLREPIGVAVRHFWAAPFAGLYAPLTYTAYALLAAAGRLTHTQMGPAWFHAASLLLHAAGGFLLWRWLCRLGAGAGPALVGALVWTVHPIQVEAVAWASSLNTVLAGFLAIASLCLAATGVSAAGWRRFAWYAASVLAVAGSLAAKPSGVLLPAVLCAAHRLLLRRPWRETLTLAAVWSIAVIPFVWVGSGAQLIEHMNPPPLLQRPLVAAHAAGWYVAKIVWPDVFAIDYGLRPAAVLADGRWAFCAAILFGVTAVVFALRRRCPAAVVGWVCFVAGVAPVLGFVPFYFQSVSTVADRYAYFAMTGVAVVIAFLLPTRWLVWGDRGGRVGGWIAAAVLLIGLGILSVRQVMTWQDTDTLMSHAFAINPHSLLANLQIGPRAESVGDWPLAERAYRNTLAWDPTELDTRAGLARVLSRTGRDGDAVPEWERVIAARPSDGDSVDRYGLSLQNIGRDRDALEQFDRAAALLPRDVLVRLHAGRLRLRLGDVAGARNDFAAVTAIDPKNGEAMAALRALSPATTRAAKN